MYESFQAACGDYEEVELSMTAESLGRIPKPSTLRKSLRGLGLRKGSTQLTFTDKGFRLRNDPFRFRVSIW